MKSDYYIFNYLINVHLQQSLRSLLKLSLTMQNYDYLKPSSRMIRSTSINTINHSTPSNQKGFSKLSNEQVETVSRLRQYLLKQSPNRKLSDDLLLRYCRVSKMSIIDSVQKFKNFDEWQSMPVISKPTQRRILDSGVFYCYGLDDAYSPNIYFHPSRVNLSDFTITDYLVSLRTLLTPIQENMLVPGAIERWNIIVDVRSLDENQLKNNFSIFLKNFQKITNAYPCRLKRLYLIFPGASTGLFSRVISLKKSNQTSTLFSMIDQLQLQAYLIKIYNLRQLDRYIPVQERQKQYGGALDDLSQFWPIASTNKLMEINSRFVQGSDQSQQYASVANDYSFFNQKQQKGLTCNFRQYCSIQ